MSVVFSDSKINGTYWLAKTIISISIYSWFTKFLRGHYFLTVNIERKSRQYKIYLVGDGDDDSNAKDYDNDQIEYSSLHIYGEAGITYPVNVEFRDRDGDGIFEIDLYLLLKQLWFKSR